MHPILDTQIAWAVRALKQVTYRAATAADKVEGGNGLPRQQTSQTEGGGRGGRGGGRGLGDAGHGFAAQFAGRGRGRSARTADCRAASDQPQPQPQPQLESDLDLDLPRPSMGRIGLGSLLEHHGLMHDTKVQVKAMMTSREG